MPFRSKAQWRKFGHLLSSGEMTQAEFDKWAHATPGGYDSLPERGPAGKRTAKDTQPKGTTQQSGKAARVATVGRVKKLGSSRARGRGSG